MRLLFVSSPMRYITVSIIFLLLLSLSSRAQVIINEVSSAGDSILADEDGEYGDWIELYNQGSVPVNLLDYSISRLEDNNNKWKFPAVIIKPQAFLTIFASKKDRKYNIDHWEKAISSTDTWHYYFGTSAPDSNWSEAAYDDSAWQQGQGGIGNGDGDDNTSIPSVYSVCLRKAFTVADTSKISMAILSIDYDDSFIAFLNGVEIARANIPGFPTDLPDFNEPASVNHEAQVYQGGKPENYKVKKSTLAEALIPGTNVLSIQVHNKDTTAGDLSVVPDLYLAVSDVSTSYPVYASLLSGLHTDFDLASSGQIISLKDASDNTVAMDTIEGMQINHSRGRTTDAGSNWCLFGLPTPGASNNGSICSTGYAGIPTFSLAAGFYSGAQTLTLSNTTGETIRYTNDGNSPDNSSLVYSSPITIDSSQVIRARNFGNGNLLPGETLTNTYFIDEEFTFPVISITTDPENLWDWNHGIYALGPDANTEAPFEGANFWKGWEKEGHIEYFDRTGEQGFELNSGLKIFGNYTKAFPQKGFRVVARDNYGTPVVDYPIFSGREYTTYKNFLVRNAGNDWNTVHFRDGLMHRIVKEHTFLDVMERQSCIGFLNGQYWGVYELREREDKNYLVNLHGVDEDKIDFLEMLGDDANIVEGSNEGFLNMADFIANNDMSVEANYDSAKNMIDIENFCDYYALEIYVDNHDWLISNNPNGDPKDVNNIRFWRVNDPPGKWRYIMWDFDVTLGLYGLYYDNNLPQVINAPNPHSVMLKQFLTNTEFKTYFINRYADLMNTIFYPANIGGVAYDIRDELAPEMPRHFMKWGNTYPNTIGAATSHDMSSWNNAIEYMQFFINHRPAAARGHVQSQFSLTKQVNVTLDVSPPGAGTIKISTVVPDSLPWTGVYYDGNPVTITATPAAGYKFSHWQSSTVLPTPDNNASKTLNIDNDDTFTAFFELLELGIMAYPNPFNSNLNIVYSLPAESKVSLKLFSITGQLVAELIPSSVTQSAGQHQFVYNPQTNAAGHGIYFLKFETGDYSKTIKLVKIAD